MENIDIKYYNINDLETRFINIEDIQAIEGELKLSYHLYRERDSNIVKIAKELFKIKNNGSLFCEICGFDFSKEYGDIGNDFIEAHHKTPISKVDSSTITRADDLLMVCSNCHSMLHKGENWIDYNTLKKTSNKYWRNGFSNR